MRRGALGTALVGAALCLGAVAAAVAPTVGLSSLAGAVAPAKVALTGSVPPIPSDVTQLGAVPGDQMVHLRAVLAGPDPAGLAAEVDAVSTPGSPQFHHYLTAAQFNALYGPSAAEVAQVTTVLRREGLTVGAAPVGSILLPVSGPASVVSAALGTPLESVRLPDHVTSLVNLAAPEVPAAVANDVTALVGLDGVDEPHSMLRLGPPAPAAGGAAAAGGLVPHTEIGHATGPQACGAAVSAAGSSSYTSTQLASVYGLNSLFAQGRTGLGQTIGVVEFEQYSSSDITQFQSCFGLTNPIHTVTVDGPVGGPASGSGESALDIEMAAANAPAASIVVYEAPNEESDAASVDLLNTIADDDQAQVVTTSWGICEALNAVGLASTENTIFSRMAAQGQTMVAAAGDAGSEDCYDVSGGGNSLGVDDPGSQRDVLSVGGTTLGAASASDQSVWNSCLNLHFLGSCQNLDLNPGNGAGGGGYSRVWPRPSWQPASGPGFTGGAGATRMVPDVSGSADPKHGVVAYDASLGGWTVFGGTSAVAPSMAGLFADTNQGCNNTVGMVGPAMYAADNSTTFTDVTSGNNDFTGTNGGDYAAATGYDPATGLGSPQDQNLFLDLQGGDGCPSISGLSAQMGPTSGGNEITINGGGFADATTVTFGSAGAGQILSESETSMTVVPPSTPNSVCVNVTVTNPLGISFVSSLDQYGFGGSGNCTGYRFVASDGGIFDFGSAAFEGSTGSLSLAAPIVGMATTPSGNGYWLVASDGGIFAFGDARYYGSMGGIALNKPIVGMAATPDGNGYWLVASDGGIFTFGAARFLGSTGSITLNKPIVGMASTGDGGGYWMVASDGGIFAFGDAQFYGSTGALSLVAPIVGMASTLDGNGYWLVASDGGIFAFGNANFDGSMGGVGLNRPIVGMAATPTGGGYWLVASDGGIFSFGDAQFFGSTGSIALNKPIVGMAAN